MLKQILLLSTVLVIISSCKKGSDGTPAPPTPPTPPAKDTSYLRKTEINYYYDATGKKLPDSSITKWTYDSKGRAVLVITNNTFPIEVDSSLYSYGTGQTTNDYISYAQGTLLSRERLVEFYNSKGLVDSSIQSGTSVNPNYGNPIVTNIASTGITAYYYDANGNDTLDIAYGLVNNVKTIGRVTRNSFINNTLTATAEYTPSGIKIYSSQWSAGNITSDSEFYFSDGTLQLSHNYTYSGVLSGGLYGYVGNKNLLATFASADPNFAANNYSETVSYTFDDANRVSTITYVYSNGQGNSQELYTYY